MNKYLYSRLSSLTDYDKALSLVQEELSCTLIENSFINKETPHDYSKFKELIRNKRNLDFTPFFENTLPTPQHWDIILSDSFFLAFNNKDAKKLVLQYPESVILNLSRKELHHLPKMLNVPIRVFKKIPFSKFTVDIKSALALYFMYCNKKGKLNHLISTIDLVRDIHTFFTNPSQSWPFDIDAYAYFINHCASYPSLFKRLLSCNFIDSLGDEEKIDFLSTLNSISSDLTQSLFSSNNLPSNLLPFLPFKEISKPQLYYKLFPSIRPQLLDNHLSSLITMFPIPLKELTPKRLDSLDTHYAYDYLKAVLLYKSPQKQIKFFSLIYPYLKKNSKSSLYFLFPVHLLSSPQADVNIFKSALSSALAYSKTQQDALNYFNQAKKFNTSYFEQALDLLIEHPCYLNTILSFYRLSIKRLIKINPSAYDVWFASHSVFFENHPTYKYKVLLYLSLNGVKVSSSEPYSELLNYIYINHSVLSQ